MFEAWEKKFPNIRFNKKKNFISAEIPSDFYYNFASYLKFDEDFIQLIDFFCWKKNDGLLNLNFLVRNLEHNELLLGTASFSAADIIPSLSKIWEAAIWCEREVHEKKGLLFSNPSSNRPLFGGPLDFKERENEFLHIPFKLRKKVFGNTTDIEFQNHIPSYHPFFHENFIFHFNEKENYINQLDLEIGFNHKNIEAYHRPSSLRELSSNLNQFWNYEEFGWNWVFRRIVKGDETMTPLEDEMRFLFCEVERIQKAQSQLQKIFQFTGLKTWERVFRKWLLATKKILKDQDIEGVLSRNPFCFISREKVLKKLSPDWFRTWREWFNLSQVLIEDMKQDLAKDSFFFRRLNCFRLFPGEALEWGVTGPSLRASGINWDIKLRSSLSLYQELGYQPILGLDGKIADRFWTLVYEIEQSLEGSHKVIENFTLSHFSEDTKDQLSDGLYMDFFESPAGEIGIIMNIRDGKVENYRLRSPSFFSLQMFEANAIGQRAEDLIIALNSFCPQFDEAER